MYCPCPRPSHGVPHPTAHHTAPLTIPILFFGVDYGLKSCPLFTFTLTDHHIERTKWLQRLGFPMRRHLTVILQKFQQLGAASKEVGLLGWILKPA